ncbi:MAG: PQQ-binding-like beta-propeller repeat protein [Candidatus Hydrogenedentes bacterium]|nr:PQQ-binding-like beta-propeller repeat protein [Candidatus Hydrogenedentota bacterium]
MRAFMCVAGVLVLMVTAAYAGDSPQFRGPHRDGNFDETGLLKTWPEGGPAKAWVATGLGRGFSSASVVGEKIYVTGMLDDKTGYVFVLNNDGVIEKKIPFGPETEEKQAPGTRSTPTIDGDRLYVISGLGLLCCIDLVKGEKMWDVNVLERFGAENNIWNVAESVLVDGNRIICTPGGKDGLLVALDKMTGETIWATKGPEDKTSYCSPTIIVHNGRRIVTTALGLHFIGADAETGALLWSFAQKAPYDIHGVTPIYKDGLLYYVAGDGYGGGALELSADGTSVTPKWTDTSLDCLHHGVVLVDGYLYGAGYKGGGKLVCLEMATGKLVWSTEEVKLSSVVYADGMLYAYEGPKAGVMNLVKATPSAFERTGRFDVTDGTDQHWAHPTIANGRLYVRHGDALIAYDVKAK